MKVHTSYVKFFLTPIYYLVHYNYILGLFHKYFIKRFYYKNYKFNLNVKDLPTPIRASFLFNTYEYNDRALVEKFITTTNKCIIIGGGIGFIATLAYHQSKKEIYVFEINKNLINNLDDNLKLNKCFYKIFNNNLVFNNKKKFTNFFLSENFLSSSKYIKSSRLVKIKNINYRNIKYIKSFNTLIIDGEGIEEFLIFNLKMMPCIKHLFFELHYNIFKKTKIKKIFEKLNENNFYLISKNFNSFYFKKGL